MKFARTANRLIGIGAILLAYQANAEVILPTDALPPQAWYVSEGAVSFAGGAFVMQNIRFHDFNVQAPPPASGSSATYNFSGIFEFDISVSGGAFQHYSNIATASWMFVNVTPFGPGMNVFEQHSLGMQTAGPGPFLVREQPQEQPTGQLTIQPVGGLYRIDSFFDVFTELSIDGGQSWIPSDTGPAHMSAVEPAPGSLAAIALCLIAARRRSRAA